MTIDEYNESKLAALEDMTLHQQQLKQTHRIIVKLFCEMITSAAKDVTSPPRLNHTLTALKESIEDIKTAYEFIFGKDLELVCSYIGMSAARIRRGVREQMTDEQMKYIEEPLYTSARRYGIKSKESGQGMLNLGV